MADTLTAIQGDTLDGLLWRERGLGAADIAPVLDANPGLAALGSVLPLGTVVTMPAAITAPAPTVRALVNLWD